MTVDMTTADLVLEWIYCQLAIFDAVTRGTELSRREQVHTPQVAQPQLLQSPAWEQQLQGPILNIVIEGNFLFEDSKKM